MHISRIMILFWVTIGIGLHALLLKKHIIFLILSSAAAPSQCIPPLYETPCFSSCLFKAPSPEYSVSHDWSTHTRLSQLL